MFDATRIKAIVFDYGNTLVEFNRPQVTRCDEALAEAVELLYGPHDPEKFQAIRSRNRRAPYEGHPPEYRENDIYTITRDLVRELYDIEPANEEVHALVRSRFDASVDAIEAPQGVESVLANLRKRYKLGLLSNYPDASAIRASLEKLKFDRLFDSVVISGDLGYAKPHPLLFQTIAKDLRVSPDEVLHVGDNWLADVQGAKRAGMSVAHVEQWPPAEIFDRQPDDHEPDLVIQSVAELEQHV